MGYLLLERCKVLQRLEEEDGKRSHGGSRRRVCNQKKEPFLLEWSLFQLVEIT